MALWVSGFCGYYGELILIVGFRIRVRTGQYAGCAEPDQFEFCLVINFFFHFISSYVVADVIRSMLIISVMLSFGTSYPEPHYIDFAYIS